MVPEKPGLVCDPVLMWVWGEEDAVSIYQHEEQCWQDKRQPLLERPGPSEECEEEGLCGGCAGARCGALV